MTKSRYLTAREAAQQLGVSLPTLYAYVSRGLLRSEVTEEGGRTRRYRSEDVRRLKERREQRRSGEKVPSSVLHWGMPVIESALAAIDNGRLYYRGHDAVSLALTHTAEQVALLLWTGDVLEDTAPFFQTAPFTLSQRLVSARRQLDDLVLFERFQVLLPLAGADDLAGYDLRPAAVALTGARIVRTLAAIAADEHIGGRLAQSLQQAWKLDPDRTRLLDAALILCADHELNVSTLTARCVASAGATPYAVVMAGLCALGGMKHGGHTSRVEALLREVAMPSEARAAIAGRLKRGEPIPGFGHPLYPDGDPRGAALLRLTGEVCSGSLAVELALVVVEQVRNLIGAHPNLDFGLATLAAALGLPLGSPLALFALGRTFGWIGHAIEQYEHDTLIRPRAHYIGEQPN